MTAFVCAGGVNGDVVVLLADHKGSDLMHKTGGRGITFSLEGRRIVLPPRSGREGRSLNISLNPEPMLNGVLLSIA